MNALQLEICAASLEALELAYKNQFDRVELSQNLEQGGLTPSAGLIQMAKDFNLNTHVLIRPRAGGFCYNEEELALMQKEIAYCYLLGVQGVVIGVLKENFGIDKQALIDLKNIAPDLDWTFHRAFDESIDWKRSLDVLIELGFKRVLTSGFASNVELGIGVLGEMCAYAKGHIEIMAGGGVNAGNISKLAHIKGLSAIHFSATQKVQLDPDSAFSETILKVSEARLERILNAI